MGKMSKVKGSSYELKIAKELSEWWGHSFHRTPASGGLRWAGENNVAGDIVAPIEAGFPFVIECKKREDWNLENVFLNNREIKDWWKQVTEDCERVGRTPVLIFSRNRASDFVALPYVADVYDALSEEGVSVMRTNITFDTLLGDTHQHDVIVTTLEGLKLFTKEYMRFKYSDKTFDWRTTRTIIESIKATRSPDDLLENL